MHNFVLDGKLTPGGYAQLTGMAAATGLTLPDRTVLTLIQAEAQSIRWRDDGTNPTASVGMILEAGQTLVYNGEPSRIKLIQMVAGAIANVTFYTR